jgi:hypothetical protein
MRVNVYAEEMTQRVEKIEKTIEGETFVGIRFYLELPIAVPSSDGHIVQHRGPFIHRPGDDDSSAVTFWGKRELKKALEKALHLLQPNQAEQSSGDCSVNQARNSDFVSHVYTVNDSCAYCRAKRQAVALGFITETCSRHSLTHLIGDIN